MKKALFLSIMAVCLMALTAGFSSCNQVVISQIFDLSFEANGVGDGSVIYYQEAIEPFIYAELAKVVEPAGGKTFIINTTEKKAKDDMKAAFNIGTQKAQEAASGSIISVAGVKAVLKYSNGNNNTPVEFVSYTFK